MCVCVSSPRLISTVLSTLFFFHLFDIFSYKYNVTNMVNAVIIGQRFRPNGNKRCTEFQYNNTRDTSNSRINNNLIYIWRAYEEITCDLCAHEIDKRSKVDWTKFNILIRYSGVCAHTFIYYYIIIITYNLWRSKNH